MSADYIATLKKDYLIMYEALRRIEVLTDPAFAVVRTLEVWTVIHELATSALKDISSGPSPQS